MPERSGGSRFNTSAGIYPFFDYAARSVFVHAKSVERYGVSSYPLLHDALTEQLVHLNLSATKVSHAESQELFFKDFDPIFMAFFHGLVLYCMDDLATRSPAPGQLFWERALRCALFSGAISFYPSVETVSLALQNIITVKQIHLKETKTSESLKLVLQHDSVRSLRLVDREGRAVTLLWLFTQRTDAASRITSKEILLLFIKRANDRGEDVRQRCGPEGNMVETLMKAHPSFTRVHKLRMLRDYYESMSWPFEYDSNEIERVK